MKSVNYRMVQNTEIRVLRRLVGRCNFAAEKKYKYMKIEYVLSMLAVAFCVTACSEKENVSTVVDIAGIYDGYVLANCAYFQNKCSADETITVSENTDGTAKITFVSDSWGEYIIPNARMVEKDGAYALSGSGEAKMDMGGNLSSKECSFTAVINSTGKAQMKFEVPAVMGGLSIDFATGEAPPNVLMAGTYKGYTDADCAYFQDKYTDGESVKLTANADGTVSVEFKSASWGTFDIASATILKNGDTYTFTGSGSVSMGMGPSTSDYDFTMTGMSDAAKDTFSIVFNIPSVMGGLTVTLLPGKAPATNE